MATTGFETTIGLGHRSLADQVYLELRQRIIEGVLPAGTWLRERELAEEFSVSRIPLREALPQLESEGFIVTHPRRGAVVRQLTLSDAVEFFDVRSSLEVLAARLAAKRVAEGADPAALRAAISRADLATEAAEAQEIAAANAQIHQAIVDLAANSLLQKSMHPINALQVWFFGVTTERDQAVQRSEHHAIVEAVIDGNQELAASLAFSHVERSRQESLPILAERLPVE